MFFLNLSASCGHSFCDSSNRLLSSLLVMFLRARRWPVGACAFHIIQPAKRTLRMSIFVYQLEKLSSLMCDKMVWLALLIEHHASGAWTSPLLPPGVPSVIVLVKIGQSRR